MSAKKLTEEEKRASLAMRLEAGSALIPWCGCRIWLGATNEHGYGVICFGRSSTLKTHRAAYMLAHGCIPDGEGYHGTVVRHSCNTPSCVNPDHLLIGTQADNMKDMANRGIRKGKLHHMRVLSEDDVREIRRSKEKQSILAKRFGVNQSTISLARNGHTWPHLGE